jgi:hypothetical protein
MPSLLRKPIQRELNDDCTGKSPSTICGLLNQVVSWSGIMSRWNGWGACRHAAVRPSLMSPTMAAPPCNLIARWVTIVLNAPHPSRSDS